MNSGIAISGRVMNSVQALTLAALIPFVAGCRDCVVEFDRTVNTQFPSQEVNRGGGAFSLQSIFKTAWIELDVYYDETDIPVLGPSGTASIPGEENGFFDSELDALRSAHRDMPVLPMTFYYRPPIFEVEVPVWDRHFLHGMIVDGLWQSSETGEIDDTSLGGVFQSIRTTFFVFYQHNTVASNPVKYFRTVAHEIGHAFNLHHEDALPFTTLMNQTEYLDPGWTFEFSETSLNHLTTHTAECVWPGPWSNLSFAPEHDPANSHNWDGFDQLCGTTPSGASPGSIGSPTPVSTPLPTSVPPTHTPSSDPWTDLSLSIGFDNNRYALGDPVYLTVQLFNSGTNAISVPSTLEPRFGNLSVSVTTPDGSRRGVSPIFLFDRDAPALLLPPKGSKATILPVFFGAHGWTFSEPGHYQLIAHFSDGTSHERTVASNTVDVEITDEIAGAFVVSETDASRQAGTFLLWQGGDHLTSGIDLLQRLIEIAPESSAANYARFALGKSLSYRFKDYSLGRWRPPMPREASDYLDAVDNSLLPLNIQLQIELARARISLWNAAESIDRGHEEEASAFLVDARRRLEESRRWIQDRPELSAHEGRVDRMEKAIARLDSGLH